MSSDYNNDDDHDKGSDSRQNRQQDKRTRAESELHYYCLDCDQELPRVAVNLVLFDLIPECGICGSTRVLTTLEEVQL